MPRTLTAAMLAEIAKGTVRPIILVEANFNSGPIYVWSGLGPLAWNGQTWQGVGDLGKISAIDETTDIQAKGITLSLSGIPSDLLGDVLGEMGTGQPVTLYLGLLDSTGQIIADPEQRFRGYMDVGKIDEGGATSTVTITVESRLLDLGRTRDRYYTDEDQRVDYPTDDGFKYVTALQEVAFEWGQSGNVLSNLPPGGRSPVALPWRLQPTHPQKTGF